MTNEKDPIAQAMVRKRWEKATPEDRKRVGAELAAARAAKGKKKPRKALAQGIEAE